MILSIELMRAFSQNRKHENQRYSSFHSSMPSINIVYGSLIDWSYYTVRSTDNHLRWPITCSSLVYQQPLDRHWTGRLKCANTLPANMYLSSIYDCFTDERICLDVWIGVNSFILNRNITLISLSKKKSYYEWRCDVWRTFMNIMDSDGLLIDYRFCLFQLRCKPHLYAIVDVAHHTITLSHSPSRSNHSRSLARKKLKQIAWSNRTVDEE